MRSFRSKPSERRQTFLRLAGEIESQLRDAYARRFLAKEATQSSLAEKLGINRSAVHHRLMGHTNMTIETIADMVWALGCKINVKITDAQDNTNDFFASPSPAAPILTDVKAATTAQVASLLENTVITRTSTF